MRLLASGSSLVWPWSGRAWPCCSLPAFVLLCNCDALQHLLAGSCRLLMQLVPSAGDNFVRKNGDYSAWESLTQHQLAAIDHGANMHMQAAPSQAEILFQNFKKKKGALQVSITDHCSCGPCQTACTLRQCCCPPSQALLSTKADCTALQAAAGCAHPYHLAHVVTCW